jgi:hypothetical protein
VKPTSKAYDFSKVQGREEQKVQSSSETYYLPNYEAKSYTIGERRE